MIFNKDDNGAAELKALLGFIYKSNSFDNMVSYLTFAERDIKKIIGKDTFKVAEDHYNSDHFHASAPEQGENPAYYAVLDELVEKIQLPVALHGYRRYAPMNDLTHSETGRSIVVTQEEKPAFQWMIDKSDHSLMELAHEATDLLLEFLDDHIDDMVTPEAEEGEPAPDPVALLPWKASPEMAAIRSLLVSREQFNQEFYIDGSRRVYLVVSPYIKKVQELAILAILGQTRYDAMKAASVAGTFSDEQTALLVNIRTALVYLSLARAVVSLSVEILPSGIFSPIVTDSVNSKNSASHSDRQGISHMLEEMGRKELSQLQEKVRKLNLVAAGETYTGRDLTPHIHRHDKIVRI